MPAGVRKRNEGDVKKDVKKWLTERRIWFYMPVQNGMGVTGIPDFICSWNGHMLAIETKAPGKNRIVTPNQYDHLMAIRQTGGIALVVDDVSQLDDAKEYHAEIISS